MSIFRYTIESPDMGFYGPDEIVWACYQCADKIQEDRPSDVWRQGREINERCEFCDKDHVDYEIMQNEEQQLNQRWRY